MNISSCVRRVFLCNALMLFMNSLGSEKNLTPIVALSNKTLLLTCQMSKKPFFLASGATLALGLGLMWPLKVCCPSFIRESAQEIMHNAPAQSMALEINLSPTEQPTINKIDQPWYSKAGAHIGVCKSIVPCVVRLGALTAASYVAGKLTYIFVNAKPMATQAVLCTQQLVNNYALLVTLHNAVHHSIRSANDEIVVGVLAEHGVLRRLSELVHQYQKTIDATSTTLESCSYVLFTDDSAHVLAALKDDMRLINGSYHLEKQEIFDAAYEHKNALELITRLCMLNEQQHKNPDDKDSLFDTAQQCNQLLMSVTTEFEKKYQEILPAMDTNIYWVKKLSPLMDVCGLAKISGMVVKRYLSSLLHLHEK